MVEISTSTVKKPQVEERLDDLPPAPGKETKGERLYDKFLYGGVGYFVNFVLSVIGGHFFLKGHGKDFYNFVREGLAEKAKPIFSEKYGKKITDEAVRILCLGAGGHLVMIPIKWLEDNKKRFVYAINRRFYPNEYGPDVPLKPLSQMKDEDLPELAETPAHMSWGKTLVRRAVIFFGIAFALAPFAKVNAALESKVKSGTHQATDYIAKVTKSEAIGKFAASKTYGEYIEVGASDLYVSAIAAVLVKMTNGAHGMFASLGIRKKPLKKAAGAPAVVAPEHHAMAAAEAVTNEVSMPQADRAPKDPSFSHIASLESQRRQSAESTTLPAL